ncbi:uncharacterized protein LOC105700706 isoform X2 [Orussus abietinus]|uniref:uncharacterized protein LOC105700706 isoform X2 n=1 Tax=Orussus abietinus TaxID=222816 RepID=UPI00062520C3|nr:uncharacterized protein LOC105700706 isoform X2 [Orussus abietinus]
MAERPGGRRRSRRDSVEVGASPSGKTEKRTKRPTRERWLLTRKTWRYMTDAGRRLIPEGVHNRPEDIPKIEQYFQEVCQREPRFLLWRKASYPGTLGFRAPRRRRAIKGGSCRTKASSADEAEDSSGAALPEALLEETSPEGVELPRPRQGGSTPSTPLTKRRQPQEDTEAKVLADMLQRYLNMNNESGRPSTGSDYSDRFAEPFDHHSLIDKLQLHLDQMMAQARRKGAGTTSGTTSGDATPGSMLSYQGDYVHKSLLETLSRYYGKSSSREHVISDILTDRKLLEKLYFDLRCTRGFRGPRATGAYTSPSAQWRGKLRGREGPWPPRSADQVRCAEPPPLISVQLPSTERAPVDQGVQTDPLSREALDAYLQDRDEPPSSKDTPSSGKLAVRRRSSVDNDDVSPSVSDTIKRYLRMARKKSIDAEKGDRFKRVNYDRNLRNIKPKGEVTKIGDDDGNHKGCQTSENWTVGFRDGEVLLGESLSDEAETASPGSRNASSRSSMDAGLGSEDTPSTPKQHQSFLSHLLHGSNSNKEKPHSAPGSPALTSSNSAGGSAMQKSKSSSSVVHHGSRLVAKKIWRSRSKSTSRASNQPSAWTPQGKCTWAGTGGRRVTLQDTPLRVLSEVERKVLCKVAVAKLQALNLGVHIRPPTELGSGGATATKPKRRAYLLKRKALTTGFFDNKTKDEKDKESAGGLVFGIPLSQCLENDRIARIAAGEAAEVASLTRSSRHGSRTSFTSLIEAPTSAATKNEEGGSCESLSLKGGALTGSDSGGLELSDSGGGAPPGEWDAVPGVVHQCIRHLESTGLRTLGIFRVSPSKKRVRQLREDFDCGRQTKIGPDQCPHDVAALMKEYFRDLPDPLLCRDLYQAFVHTQKIRNRRLQQEALQHLIQLLPTPNRETLWALLNFLSEVASNSEDKKTETGDWISGNKMDTTNLATVFAPNILHCVKHGQARAEVSAERAEERIDVINVAMRRRGGPVERGGGVLRGGKRLQEGLVQGRVSPPECRGGWRHRAQASEAKTTRDQKEGRGSQQQRRQRLQRGSLRQEEILADGHHRQPHHPHVGTLCLKPGRPRHPLHRGEHQTSERTSKKTKAEVHFRLQRRCTSFRRFCILRPCLFKFSFDLNSLWQARERQCGGFFGDAFRRPNAELAAILDFQSTRESRQRRHDPFLHP